MGQPLPIYKLQPIIIQEMRQQISHRLIQSLYVYGVKAPAGSKHNGPQKLALERNSDVMH